MQVSNPCQFLNQWSQELIVQLLGLTSYLDCGDYYLSTNAQGSDAWKDERKFRVTASKMGSIIHANQFKSRTQLMKQLISQESEQFSARSIANMARGTALEPKARNYYVSRTGYKVTERGIVIPKWNLWIGASCDGDVLDTEGIIEIKCPRSMYPGLLEYAAASQRGEQIDIKDYIWKSYYCQMQANMALMGKQWCDYVVYVETDLSRGVRGQCAIYRVPFDRQFWVEELYPAILQFLIELQPKLQQSTEISFSTQLLIPPNVYTQADLEIRYTKDGLD